MKLIDKTITKTELKDLAQKRFGNLVKAVVDIKKQIMVVDADLHADEEAFLLAQGSDQENLWGINLYPDLINENFIEFDSMINLRPGSGNSSRGVDNPEIKMRIVMLVTKIVK